MIPEQTTLSLSVQCNPWAKALYGNDKMYTVFHGGRGGGKDYAVCQWLAIQLLNGTVRRAVCTRHHNNKIADSLKRMLEDVIEDMGLEQYFRFQQYRTLCVNGGEVSYRGLWSSVEGIKGLQGYDVCLINEAQEVSAEAWHNLDATIRKEGSQIIIMMNPENPEDALAKEFLGEDLKGYDRDDTLLIRVNAKDNKYLSNTAIRKRERYLQNYPNLYPHEYEGEYCPAGATCPFPAVALTDVYEMSALPLPEGSDSQETVCGVDPAYSGPGGNDYTACVKLDIAGNTIDVLRFQESDVEIKNRHIAEFCQGSFFILVDNTRDGGVTVQSLQKNYGLHGARPFTFSRPSKTALVRSGARRMSERRVRTAGFPELQRELRLLGEDANGKIEATIGNDDLAIAWLLAVDCLERGERSPQDETRLVLNAAAGR